MVEEGAGLAEEEGGPGCKGQGEEEQVMKEERREAGERKTEGRKGIKQLGGDSPKGQVCNTGS